MEERNVFLWGKAAVCAACGAFTAAFGWLGWLIAAWAACMALDWLSGSAAAASRGQWSSAAARAGIWHKAGMLVVVLVSALTDAVLGMAAANLPGLELPFDGVVLPVVLVWYIFTELGSIAENAAAMGAPVPGWLVKILAEGKEKVEKNRCRGRRPRRPAGGMNPSPTNVGRGALTPPPSGQDPSLQRKPVGGITGKAEGRACPAPTRI